MKLKCTILALIVAAITGPLATLAMAADTPVQAHVQSLGVIDINKVLQTSDAAKGIFSDLEGKRKEFQAQITKEEDSLRASGQEFEKQKSTLTKEQLDAKRKEIDERLYNGQKMVQERKAMLDHAFSETMGKLRTETTKIVAEIAKARGFSAVLTQDAVMLSVPEMDLTSEVIKQLNEKVKKVPVEWPAVKKGKKDKKVDG